MKTKKMFEVIREFTAIASGRDANEVIYRDNNGKIYFADSKYNKIEFSPKVGDKALGMIVKELDKIGYVKFNIGNKTLTNYITTIPKMTMSDIVEIPTTTWLDEHKLNSSMYSYDLGFMEHNAGDAGPIVELPLYSEMSAKCAKYGINGESGDFKADYIELLAYLHNKYNFSRS